MKEDEMAVHTECMEEVRTAGKRSLRRHRCRWEDNIKMDLRVGRYGLEASGSG
jgi:hypothetical protein